MTETTIATATQKIPTPDEVFAYLSAEQAVKKAKEEDEYQQMRADVIRSLRSGKTENIELYGTQIPRLISELEAVGWVTTLIQARGAESKLSLTVRSGIIGSDELSQEEYPHKLAEDYFIRITDSEQFKQEYVQNT